MDTQLAIICVLTFGINLIGTLAYAARIAGVRTRRIAMSFALFNVLVLVSRTANGFLGPFLAKRIESRLLTGGGHALADDFRMVLGSASLAVFIGILLVPTGQRLFARLLDHRPVGHWVGEGHAQFDHVAAGLDHGVHQRRRNVGEGETRGDVRDQRLALLLLQAFEGGGDAAHCLGPPLRVRPRMEGRS